MKHKKTKTTTLKQFCANLNSLPNEIRASRKYREDIEAFQKSNLRLVVRYHDWNKVEPPMLEPTKRDIASAKKHGLVTAHLERWDSRIGMGWTYVADSYALPASQSRRIQKMLVAIYADCFQTKKQRRPK